MEKKNLSIRFRREAIFKAAKTSTSGNFLTLIGIWFICPKSESFNQYFLIFASIVSLMTMVIIYLGITFSTDFDEKKQRKYECSYYGATLVLTSAMGIFLVFLAQNFGFLSIPHLGMWVFVMATVEALASYLFHIPRFFIYTFICLNFPLVLWMLNYGTKTSYTLSAIVVVYAPMLLVRISELTKLRNYTIDQTNKALEKENQLQTFLDLIPSNVSWLDSHLRYMGINKKLRDLLGAETDIIGKSLDEIGQDDPLTREIRSFAASDELSRNIEVQIEIDGEERWHLCTFSKFDFGHGDEIFLVTVDIQDEKMLSVEVQRQKIIGEQASRLANLGEMASGIAHEINNPLAISQGTASILKEKLEMDIFDKSDFLKKLTTIVDAHDRVIEVVRGMRSYSKFEISEKSSIVNIQDIIKSTLVLCTEKLKSESIKLNNLLENEDIEFKCRKQEISQVLLSFIHNSIDSIAENTEVEGRIDIYLERDNDNFKICVLDNGRGIDNTEKIFVPFYTTKGPDKAVGLGLSHSLRIANSYNGTIEVVSSDMTIFKLVLPNRLIQK